MTTPLSSTISRTVDPYAPSVARSTPRKIISSAQRTKTNRREGLINAHANSPSFRREIKFEIKDEKKSEKLSRKSEKNEEEKSSNNKKNLPPDYQSTSSDDESSIVSDPESSDDDLDDLMPIVAREKIEKHIIQPSTHTKKADFKRQEEKETDAIKEARIRKYAMDFVSGGILQFLSFGVGGVATIATGNPWAFPVVSAVMHELLGEKVMQITRSSTLVIPETQQYLAIQRQLGHALGDLFVACANKDISKKFEIKVNNKTEKVTASEALKHMGFTGAAKACGKNFLVRGLPFAWFCLLYGLRDWQILDQHGGYFSGNATTWCQTHTPQSNCTNLEQLPSNIDPTTLKMGINLLVGALAGAATALSGQLVASALPNVTEKPNFSTDYYTKKVAYLESLKEDVKDYIDTLNPNKFKFQDDYEKKLEAAWDLDRSIVKELKYAKKKSSTWTTYIAEVDLATQKKRDSTMVTPEFGGKRIDMVMSITGKILSLLVYSYIIQRFVPQNPNNSDQEKLLGQILIPLTLIFIGGFAFRDDLRIIPQTIYGAGKGIVRAFKSSGRRSNEHDDSPKAENDTVVNMEGAVEDEQSDEAENEPYLSNGNTHPDGTPIYNDDKKITGRGEGFGRRNLQQEQETSSDDEGIGVGDLTSQNDSDEDSIV